MVKFRKIIVKKKKHFENLAKSYPTVQEIYSLWTLLKKRIEDELIHSRNIFVNYSLHDGSHSRSIIQAIERFLGDERICQLSATDTFMLLACAYSHDYGMAQTFDKIYHILGSAEFEEFLAKKEKKLHLLEQEDAWAVENLLAYINDKKACTPLNDLYFYILLYVYIFISVMQSGTYVIKINSYVKEEQIVAFLEINRNARL